MNKIDLARDLVLRIPNAPARTLARRLVLDYPDIFASVDQARHTVRAVLGTDGEHNRKKTRGQIPRQTRAAGYCPEFPPSSADPWTPVVLPVPGVVLSISDLHVPYHDQRAIETAVNFAKKRHKITDLLINGDYGDFYRLSRFDKSPLKRTFRQELATQRDGLVYLREKFPKQRRWFKRGNHDEWWNKWVWNHAPELADCEHMQLGAALKLANYGYTEIGDVPVMASELPILHGHEFGKGGGSSVNPARGAFLKAMHSCLVSHWHTTSQHTRSDMFNKEMASWSQACLCFLHPEYARMNNWNLGFAVIEYDKNSYNVLNYRIGTGGEVRAS